MSVLTTLFSAALEAGVPRNLYTGEGAQLFGSLASGDETEFEELARASEHLPENATVGELASGEGRLLLSLDSPNIREYYAYDTSPILLSLLQQRATRQGIPGEKVKTCCQDLLTWEPQADTFDFLLLGAGTVRLFDHQQRLKIYQRVHQALRSGGVFYISTSEPQNNHGTLFSLGQVNLNGKPVVPFFYAGEIPGQEAREIGFVVFDTDMMPKPARVYSSVVHNLSGDQLASELQETGFSIVNRTCRECTGLADSQELLTIITVKVGG